MLMGIVALSTAGPALCAYLVIYVIMNMGAFAVLAVSGDRREQIADRGIDSASRSSR